MKLTAETDSQAKAETSFFLDQFFRLRLATERSADVKLLVRRISHLDGLFFLLFLSVIRTIFSKCNVVGLINRMCGKLYDG